MCACMHGSFFPLQKIGLKVSVRLIDSDGARNSVKPNLKDEHLKVGFPVTLLTLCIGACHL